MATSKPGLFMNGLNGATGDYLLPPMTPSDLARLARGETLEESHRKDLQIRDRLATQKTLQIIAGRDPGDLSQAGWGVIFASDCGPDVRDALAELLEHRRAAAAAQKEIRYREYTGDLGYRVGESASEFLGRHGVWIGPANPDKMPYYLLIVGDPESIPYRFQYQLDVDRAVGRIHFDSVEDYSRYAHSVVAAERSVKRPPKAVFFGVRNDDDPATESSSTDLVMPLARALGETMDGWNVETVVGNDQATKDRLGRLLGGDDTPALLFSATHGLGFPAGDPRILDQQGALVCQDWPGPRKHAGGIPRDHYFTAEDILDDARVWGTIGFCFACFGAGTPRLDDFAHHAFNDVAPIAPHAFVAAIPKRLLGHPNGGMLAFVGHVERAWGTSFAWPGAGPQIDVFESTLQQLMAGMPVGAALEYFNGRYAAVSTMLTDELNAIRQTNKIPNEEMLAGLWIANNDARGYAIIGDPAVRLAVSDGGLPQNAA